MDKRLKEETLARIKDPKVREHYRAKLDMADELEGDGIRTGGIFDVPGVPASGYVTSPIETKEHGVEESGYVTSPIEPTTRPKSQVSSFVPGLVAVVTAFLVAAIMWWLR